MWRGMWQELVNLQLTLWLLKHLVKMRTNVIYESLGADPDQGVARNSLTLVSSIAQISAVSQYSKLRKCGSLKYFFFLLLDSLRWDCALRLNWLILETSFTASATSVWAVSLRLMACLGKKKKRRGKFRGMILCRFCIFSMTYIILSTSLCL